VPLASPLGSFGPPGLRFTRSAPAILLYYNKYAGLSSACGHEPGKAIPLPL